MKQANEEGRKIPFFFIPIPNFLFEGEYFKDAGYFRFLCFAFSRTAFEAKATIFNGQTIFLDPLEFIFGRNKWAEYLEIAPSDVRRYICQLNRQQIVSKVASKSTSKLSVFKWVSARFLTNFSQQINQKTASQLPSKPPQIKNIRNKKEEQQQLKVFKTSQILVSEKLTVQAASALPRLIGKAKRMLNALPEQKRDAVIALFHMRSKSQLIENPDAWLIKCIEEDWLEEEKLEVPNDEKNPSDFDCNRAFASELVRKLEGLPGLHICLRNDFLELGNMKLQIWQIFFCEAPQAFQCKVKYILRELGNGHFVD